MASPKRQIADGPPGGGMMRQAKRGDFVTAKQCGLVDFVEVVVLSGQPEDGDMRIAGAGRFRRQVNGGCSLHERHERTAEERDLLTGHHGACSCGQAIQVGLCFRARTKFPVLLSQ